MTRTILISVAAFFLIAGAWTVNLVTYHPSKSGLDPLSPVTVTLDHTTAQPPV